MARNLGNPFTPSGETRGSQFEHEICEYLRRNLPDSYVYLHSVVVSAAAARSADKKARRVPREIDIAVAGPNGLFLIEAKDKGPRFRVEGTLMGMWTFLQLSKQGRPKGKSARLGKPGEQMRIKLTQVQNLVRGNAPQALRPYQYARILFVFPDTTDIRVIEHDTQLPPAGDSQYRLVHLSELAERITSWPPPYLSRDGQPAPRLNETEAETLLRLLSPGVVDPHPEMVLHYSIVKRQPVQIASNGLPYAICELYHNELGIRRRGKWYDWSQLRQKDRNEFETQMKRHARVLAALEGHKHIHQYKEFFADPHSGGYWLIEEWVEGDTLAAILAGQAAFLDVGEVAHQVALALKALHDNGYVHRELNPQAILVETGTNRAIVTNFELAKAMDGSPTVSPEKITADPYRAPEVATDPHSVDVRADIYSWGAILFHMLTGRPMGGQQELELLERTSLPPKIRRLIARCLYPGRSERPNSMDEIIKQIRTWRSS